MTTRAIRAVSAACPLLCEVTVHVEGQRIVRVDGHCPDAAAWFGDGSITERILVHGQPGSFDAAIDTAANLLADSHGSAAVFLGPALTVEAMKPVVALADLLEAVVDTATTPAASQAILAGQRRGRAAATLGEIRNRSDVVLLWGVSLERAPCVGRRLLDAIGTHVPAGRAGRQVIAVSIGQDGSAAGSNQHVALAPEEEVTALALLVAHATGRSGGPITGRFAALAPVAAQLAGARYATIIARAEEGDASRAAQRAEALVALAQALNGPTRAALLTLRAGENRNGAEAILTWQTGYPFAVSFRSGVPVYVPDRRGLHGDGAALIAGDWKALPPGTLEALGRRDVIIVGPGASDAPLAARVAIDTGRAGLHEGGTAYRTDDIPVELVAVVDGARTAAMTLGALGAAVGTVLRTAAT